jgi:hypothetical protein
MEVGMYRYSIHGSSPHQHPNKFKNGVHGRCGRGGGFVRGEDEIQRDRYPMQFEEAMLDDSQGMFGEWSSVHLSEYPIEADHNGCLFG